MDTRARNRIRSQAAWCIALALMLGCRSSAIRESEGTTCNATAVTPVNEIALTGYVSVHNRTTDAKQNELAGPHSVDFYVRYALANNQAIQAAVKEVEAARNRIPQARSLEDPMLDAKGYPFFPNTPQSASGRATGGVGVSQKFPWFGKLRLQGEIAHQELHVVEAQLAPTQLEITEQVKRAYFEIHYVQHGISITEQNRNALEQIAKIAQVTYEVERKV